MLQGISPLRNGIEPLRMALVDHAYKLITLFAGIIKEHDMIGPMNGDGKILEAAPITAANIGFGNIVPTGKHTIGYTEKVDLNVVRSNVNKHDLRPFVFSGFRSRPSAFLPRPIEPTDAHPHRWSQWCREEYPHQW